MGYSRRHGPRLISASNADPLPGIEGIWTNAGSSTSVGLYQDTACTDPVDDEFQSIAGWKNERTGAIIATQSNASKQPFSMIVGGKMVMYSDGVDDGMVTNVNLLNPFSLAVTAAVVTGSNFQRLLQSMENNRVLTFGRGTAAVFLGGVVVNNTGSTVPNSAVGILTDDAHSTFWLNGTDVTDNPDISADWGTVGLFGEGTNPEVPDGYITGLFWKAGIWTADERAAIESFAATINPA